jgi:hypothetical protein
VVPSGSCGDPDWPGAAATPGFEQVGAVWRVDGPIRLHQLLHRERRGVRAVAGLHGRKPQLDHGDQVVGLGVREQHIQGAE